MKNKIELIKTILIVIVLIELGASTIIVTNKIVELDKKIDKIKLLNGMFFEDMERTYEYAQEQGIDSEIKID